MPNIDIRANQDVFIDGFGVVAKDTEESVVDSDTVRQLDADGVITILDPDAPLPPLPPLTRPVTVNINAAENGEVVVRDSTKPTGFDTIPTAPVVALDQDAYDELDPPVPGVVYVVTP